MFLTVFPFIRTVQLLANLLQSFSKKCKFAVIFGITSYVIISFFFHDQAAAEENAQPSDLRVGLYFNYYLPNYTNTPLLIRRDCTCQLGYQSGVVIQDRMFWRFWFNLHGYVLGSSPRPSKTPEQYGMRLEGQIRFNRFTIFLGYHGEWDIYRSSNFPTTSMKGNYISTGGLRETYIGITWWLY